MTKQSYLAVGLTACALWMSGCASEGTTMFGSSASGGAASVQNDSLQACLARIPSTGSAGNRQIAEEGCRRDEALRLGIVGSATTKSGDRVAAGTHGDSLDACMARIPKDATAGQKMLAEESCRRDQAARR
jgi:hypothetical protein